MRKLKKSTKAVVYTRNSSVPQSKNGGTVSKISKEDLKLSKTMKSKKPVNAVIYVRNNSDDGSAVASQFQNIYDYAFNNNIQIIKSYCDVLTSGTRMGPDLIKLLKEINSNSVEPKIVICTELYRFGRSHQIYSKVKSALDSKSIKIISLIDIDSSRSELLIV